MIEIKGSKRFLIGTLDILGSLKVAGYLAASAILSSLIESISSADFSGVSISIGSIEIPGGYAATAVVNILLYLLERTVRDTR